MKDVLRLLVTSNFTEKREKETQKKSAPPM